MDRVEGDPVYAYVSMEMIKKASALSDAQKEELLELWPLYKAKTNREDKRKSSREAAARRTTSQSPIEGESSEASPIPQAPRQEQASLTSSGLEGGPFLQLSSSTV